MTFHDRHSRNSYRRKAARRQPLCAALSRQCAHVFSQKICATTSPPFVAANKEPETTALASATPRSTHRIFGALLRKIGSHETRRWRGVDSNHQYRVS